MNTPLLFLLLGTTLGILLLLSSKELFCSVKEGFWGGISSPLCAKAEKKKVKALKKFEEDTERSSELMMALPAEASQVGIRCHNNAG